MARAKVKVKEFEKEMVWVILSLDHAVKTFLNSGEATIPPHLINPFLRVMETMEKECIVTLKFDKMAAPGNPKAFYKISINGARAGSGVAITCSTCKNRQPQSAFQSPSPKTLCSSAGCNADNGYRLWEPSVELVMNN